MTALSLVVVTPQVATLALADALYLSVRGFDIWFVAVQIAWICMTFAWMGVSAAVLRGPSRENDPEAARRPDQAEFGGRVVPIDWVSRRGGRHVR